MKAIRNMKIRSVDSATTMKLCTGLNCPTFREVNKMKCDHLIGRTFDGEVYVLASEAMEAIAELKQKLEDAGMRERRLKRAFLIALAHKAKYKKYWYCELLKQEGSKILSDNKKAKKYNAIIKMCQECEVKCLKKEEEYK